MQIFAKGKQRFYSFMEFYVIHIKNQGKFRIPPNAPTNQYHVFLVNMHYTTTLYTGYLDKFVAFKNFKHT